MKTTNTSIQELTIEFSLELISYCESLESSRKFVISQQLLKAGTSIGANVHEAQSPESRLDFLHKMKIAAKEAKETKYWLILCTRAPSYPKSETLMSGIDVIQSILSKIIATTRQSLRNRIKQSRLSGSSK